MKSILTLKKNYEFKNVLDKGKVYYGNQIIVYINKNKKEKNIIDVIDGSLEILCHELSIYELNGVDSLINISTEDISLLDVKKIEELYNIGYVITKEYIEDKK